MVSGIEFEMAVLVIAPVAMALTGPYAWCGSPVVAASLLLLFEAALIYRFWVATQTAAHAPAPRTGEDGEAVRTPAAKQVNRPARLSHSPEWVSRYTWDNGGGTMITRERLPNLIGADVRDRTDQKVGTVGHAYVDDAGTLTWMSVKTGWFGRKENLVPMESRGDRRRPGPDPVRKERGQRRAGGGHR